MYLNNGLNSTIVQSTSEPGSTKTAFLTLMSIAQIRSSPPILPGIPPLQILLRPEGPTRTEILPSVGNQIVSYDQRRSFRQSQRPSAPPVA
jgi:hypothetical protein